MLQTYYYTMCNGYLNSYDFALWNIFPCMFHKFELILGWNNVSLKAEVITIDKFHFISTVSLTYMRFHVLQ